MDEKYNEYVKRFRSVFDGHKKVECYPIYFCYREDGIWFRFHNTIIYHHEDKMTLKDIEQKIMKDLPFIGSVQFYDECGYHGGIIL